MPSPRRQLRARDVERFVRERCFAAAQDDLVGVELEQLVFHVGQPRVGVDHAAVTTAVAASRRLPGGSTVTFEPGGQLEVSSPPCRGPEAACAAAAGDLAAVGAAFEAAGLRLVGMGLDPLRPCRRVTEGPRYRAMEAYFDAGGSTGIEWPPGHHMAPSHRTGRTAGGRTMMCSTASVQINLDIGSEAAQGERWRLAHRLGPVLLASFANSPFIGGVPHGLRSGRAAVWASIDPTRTDPAVLGAGQDPAAAWAGYALAARVMLVRVSERCYEPMLAPLPFARWIDEGHELGWPTGEDLEYHLSTLFPPVRPRGWLELRMLDALPAPWWQVAVAVSAALVDDGEAAARAMAATVAVEGMWADAARHGLAHPALAGAARTCFAAALEALPRLGAGASTIGVVADFSDRFVDRGRCPADDLLDGWRRHGECLPRPLPLEASWT